LDVILGVDHKSTAGQSPDFKDPDDASPITDVTTIERPDNGDRRRQPDNDARVISIPEVDSDSVIDIRQNDDDRTTGVERSGGDAGVEASGLVNSDSTVGYGQGDDAGVGAMGLVNSDSGADVGWSDDVAGIGLVDSISSGNVVSVDQLEGGTGTGEVWVHDDGMGTLGQQGYGKGSVSVGPGELGNLGVGDGSRSYTCDPDDGVRPGHYISGRGDNLRPSDEVSGRDDERDERWFPRTVRRQADSESTTGQADRLQDASDGAAIAGDPMSSTRLRDRPRRTVKLPVRFKDFDMP